MSEKIVKFLVELLKKVKKLIPILHSSVVEQDSDHIIKVEKIKIRSKIVNYVEKHGASELVILISALFSSLAALLLCVFFIIAFGVI